MALGPVASLGGPGIAASLAGAAGVPSAVMAAVGLAGGFGGGNITFQPSKITSDAAIAIKRLRCSIARSPKPSIWEGAKYAQLKSVEGF
jgi:hypothetical protein